jgi:tetratricopeptide (TPR) repeat protein
MKYAVVLVLALNFICASLSIASPGEPDSRALEQFIRGTVASQMDNHYQALFHFQEALRSDPKAPYIHVALAQEYILLEQPDRALETLEDVLKISPLYTEALELKAAVQRALGEYAAAIKTLEKLTQIAPDNFRYNYDLLFGYLSVGDYDRADAIYRNHIQGTADVEQLVRQILSVYVMAEEYDRAVPYMNQLLNSDTLDASLIYSMGTLYLHVGDTLLGESLVKRAIEIEPSEPRFWFARVVLEYDRKNYDNVLSIADEAIKASGEQASLRNILGNTYQRMGKQDEAIASFSKAIELDSTNFAGMGALALIYDGLDSLARVVELYERAIALSDSTPVYLNNLAYTYAERGIELEKARLLVVRALESEPENASYLDTMGWVEFREGNYSEAAEWLHRAVKLDPNSAPLYEHLGDTYLKLGREAKARGYYRKGLIKDPQNQSIQSKIGQQ